MSAREKERYCFGCFRPIDPTKADVVSHPNGALEHGDCFAFLQDFLDAEAADGHDVVVRANGAVGITT